MVKEKQMKELREKCMCDIEVLEYNYLIDTGYSRTSIARTPTARLPWLMQTSFFESL